jgi:ribosome maturation factor RimP
MARFFCALRETSRGIGAERMAGKKRRRRQGKKKVEQTPSKPMPAGAEQDLESWAREAAEVHDLELYDVTLSRGSNLVRVYVKKPGKPVPGEGVTIDQCAEVSRYIEALVDAEESYPERYTMEVSTPGIERALERPSHWAGAIGEDVRVVLRQAAGDLPVLAGELVAWDAEAEALTVDCGEEHGQVTVAASEVKRAKVTFEF